MSPQLVNDCASKDSRRIKVILCEDKIHAKECRNKPEFYHDTPFVSGMVMAAWRDELKTAKTFEIEEFANLEYCDNLEDEIFDAYILDNGKIRIEQNSNT